MDAISAYPAVADSVVTTFAVIASIYAFTRFLNRKLERKILDEVSAATREIQPNANGGRSLADLHKKVDLMCAEMQIVKQALGHLEYEVEQLEEDVEDLR